jgi:hypothetical protein
MSESASEGAQAPVPPAMLRAMQPPGAVFALGWAMAELFDPRRRESVSERQPAFDESVQLPTVHELQPVPKLLFYVAELTELAHYYPDLAEPVAVLGREADKSRPESTEPFSQDAYNAAAQALNEAILDGFADDPERLNAYQLGLELSDMCWLPHTEPGGDQAAGTPAAFIAMFARDQVAMLRTLLSGAGSQLPLGSAAVVSQSIEHWADWIDINVTKIRPFGAVTWAPTAGHVLQALRVQGMVWHSVLIADPDVTVEPGMGAWVQAASSVAHAVQRIGSAVLRRFWPLVLIGLALLGGLLYLVISSLSGQAQVWASLVTVGAIVGGGGVGLGSSVSSAFGGIGYEIWSTVTERTALDRRGVAAPHVRKHLDIA